MRLYKKSVYTLHLNEVCIILEHSEVGNRTTFDGTPSFSFTECIMVQFVINYFHIVELVAIIDIFKNISNCEEIYNHIIHTIHITFRLEVKLGFDHVHDNHEINVKEYKRQKDKEKTSK